MDDARNTSLPFRQDVASTSREPVLTVIPSLHAARLADGRIGLTRKFVAGSGSYSSRWPGTVRVLLQSGPVGDNLDNQSWGPEDLPFEVVLDGDLRTELARSQVVLASATRDQAHIAAICRELGVPVAYVTEYSLRTRFQIIGTTTPNPLRKLRRAVWEYRTERMVRSAIGLSSGVQCNGTPTFEAYRSINPSPLLFFDTRTSDEALVDDAELEARLAVLDRGEPLQLFFSGRLIQMKGASHLVEVARHLHALGFPFHLTICGDGDLLTAMREKAIGLPVTFTGTLDFETELQPLLQRSADLFVCCHLQGDPSCTYLETLSCGVPIIGYDNEAFAGVRAASGTGWEVPMNRPEAMAARIASLTRYEIAVASRQSLEFARKHTFESTFDARIAHLQSLLAPAAVGKPA